MKLVKIRACKMLTLPSKDICSPACRICWYLLSYYDIALQFYFIVLSSLPESVYLLGEANPEVGRNQVETAVDRAP